MKNKIKYIVVIVVLIGVFCFYQFAMNKSKPATQNGNIELDQNGKQIIDNEGTNSKDDEVIKGSIDKSTLSEEELRDYENYDPLGKNANDQETSSKE